MITIPVFAVRPDFSKKFFDKGVLLRETGGPIDNCLQEPETKIFCEEGFWLRDAFFQWSYKSNDSAWPFPFPLSAVQAVSIGMALAFRFPFLPESYKYLGHYSSYLSDGWGFMSAISVKSVQPPCPSGELQKYCEFGRGRASFFNGQKAITPTEKAGRSFAEGMHGIPVPYPYDHISGVLRGKAVASLNLKKCLFSRHILDCAVTTP